MTTLEDNVEDIVGKAMGGLGLATEELSSRAGVAPAELRSLLAGRFDPNVASQVARALGLDGAALARIGRGEYRPGIRFDDPGLARFTTSFGGMQVNAYLVWDAASGHAAAFDTGADPTPILERCREEKVRLGLLLLTHGHRDHVVGLDPLTAATGAEVWAGAGEKVHGAQAVSAGREFALGTVRVTARPTPGHSPGGVTYVIAGLSRPIAIVGDALFAGSMGRATHSYQEAMDGVRREILTLPPDTVLCPGHGPLTTVGLERANNPFFAGYA